MPLSTNTLIIGAGAAGLASAACLSRHRIPTIILDRNDVIGDSWLHRYERLHLHTHSFFSALPYLSFPKEFPRYPSREQFASYLKSYATAFNITPRLNQAVSSARHNDGLWEVETQNERYVARNLVVASGYSNKPKTPSWPGQDTFPGAVKHSATFTNGATYKGKQVLVVGFGNSAGEIALDLHEHGAKVDMAVRNSVNIVPRDLFGLSTHVISVIMSRLPTEVADALSSNLRKLVVGDMKPYGLEPAPLGPMTMIKRENRVPLLDIGTVALIKQGAIKIQKDLTSFEGQEIIFSDGTRKAYDAVILATGYSTDLASFLPDVTQVSDERGRIAGGGRETALPGLFFCGLHNAPAGLLRQIGIEARRIANSIKKKNRSIPSLAMS